MAHGNTTHGNTTHGNARGRRRSPAYESWARAHDRATPGNARYSAGLDMDPRWRESFQEFLSDLGPRPEGHVLSRRDFGRGYWPDNCFWEEYWAYKRRFGRWTAERRVDGFFFQA